MNDLISRQAVIEELHRYFSYGFDSDEFDSDEYWNSTHVMQAIANVPIVEPKTGHWIDYYGEVEIYNAGGFTETRKIGVKCSVCQWINRWYAGNYCGNCGAKMEGGEEHG